MSTRPSQGLIGGSSVDRREFMQGIGAAGFVVATATGSPLEAVEQAAAAAAAGPYDFPKPPGLKPLAQFDSRFPMAYETSVPEAMRLVTQYFSALSQRNLGALSKTLHYPFAIVEGTEPIVVESASDLLKNPPPTLDPSGKGASRIMPGSYDLLEKLELHLYGLVGAGLALSFTRYTPNGHKLLECDGIYGVTNNDGTWGIELVSTIYTPIEHVGLEYRDAEESALRRGRDWMLGYNLRDQSVLNSTRTLWGKSASVSFGYGPRERAGDARNNRPMAGWKVKGVKSRLQVSNTTKEQHEQQLARADANFPEFANWAGGGVGQWDFTMNLPGARVLHATVDKAHTTGGYLRYTANGTLISETRSLGIRVYRHGIWGDGGGIGQITHHDRTNSIT